MQTRNGPPRIGVLLTTPNTYPGYVAFRERLAALGYVDGKNIEIEERFTPGRLELLPGFAKELIDLDVEVIAVLGAVTVHEVRKISMTVPVVFTVVLDPVADGLVENAQRPGGLTTGLTSFDPEQAPSQMRLLKEIVPNLSRVAILGDAGVPDLLEKANKQAAEANGLRALSIRLKGADENMDAVFESIRREGAGAVIGLEVPAVGAHGTKIAMLATANRLPTLFAPSATRFKPMLAYGTSVSEGMRGMASMVDRVLKGAKPSDMPIERVTRHYLTVNLQLAREIGLAIPREVLARADEVIE
jgi:putative ABC transport system substrate-binding protein